MLVTMGSTHLEEFYPAVTIASLMRIMRDPALSDHHTTVIQAVQFIFNNLGMKGVQYLPQLMPSYLNVIRTCDPSFREVWVFFYEKFLRNIFKERKAFRNLIILVKSS